MFLDVADVYISLAKMTLTLLTGLKGKNKLHSTALTLKLFILLMFESFVCS